ncbi:alanine racemase [Peribacillus deserti]|uniref:Alanine racemase n=1 Tax=Peribacillus deserti TaxID=673318 RepID=A0A2N5M0R7_9BACI|nr:alanine racemase [Peribacillus deserti]PLT27959.1 alanine racemase [Peribacillus deserti]
MENTNFYRDTWAEINLDSIYNNVANMKQHLPEDVRLFAVVKANAYGHGYEQTARAALEAGADYLAVAFLDEALHLRNKGLDCPILVLGASRPEDASLAAENNISLTVFTLEWLEEAKGTGAAPIKVHIKCDTGMGRLGFKTKEEIAAAEKVLCSHPAFEFEGIFTHFATADEVETQYYEKQLRKFEEMVGCLESKPKLIHSSNSAASLRFTDSLFNAARLGISMYGLSPSPEIKPLLPYQLQEAMSLKTKIVSVKKLHKGESVSYGAVYTALEDEWIAVLPIGYADGFLRKLQGQEVLVKGLRAPIIGRVCMDQCMIKLPYNLDVGTEVTLIGSNGEQTISVDEIAEKMETINYEVTCLVAARVPRVYIKNGKKIITNNSLLD